MNHRERHPTYVESCWACKALSVSIGASATPTRRPEAVAISARDERWDRDMAAYKRLRRDGLQPTGIDGSAEVEKRVNSQFELDLGHVVPREHESRVQEAMAISKDLGLLTEGGK